MGTHDVLPPESDRWVDAVATFADRARRFGYGLVVTPIFEHLEVFQRVGTRRLPIKAVRTGLFIPKEMTTGQTLETFDAGTRQIGEIVVRRLGALIR